MREQLTDFFDHFRNDHTFEAIRAHADKLAAMQRAVDKRWPAMKLTVLAVREDTLIVQARNSALAAKSRQIAPSLLDAVAAYAPTLTQVRVKAAPSTRKPVPPQRDKTIADSGLEHLQDAASGLPPGRLRRAIERIIKRQLDA